MHQILGQLACVYRTTVYKKKTFPKRQRGFCWKTNGGNCSCASVGQQHAKAHTRTIVHLPISIVVTLTDAKKQGHWNPPLNHQPAPPSLSQRPTQNLLSATGRIQKSVNPLNTKQPTRAWRPLTCAIIRLKAASVVPRVVVAIPIVLIRAGRLGIVSRVESSARNTRMEVFTPSP